MKVLALNTNGDLTYCSVPPESRGVGRCNHVEHQNPGESLNEFLERISEKQTKLMNDGMVNDVDANDAKEITQEEIDAMALALDSIAGEKLTVDNFKEIISKLTPEQIDNITKISFNAAPVFSLPITDENYEDENVKNKIYFANLPEYGIGGNMPSIAQMFDKVGDIPISSKGDMFHVEHSFKQGLTPKEYFLKQFMARDALINKGVSTEKPGYCVFKDSIVEVVKNETYGYENDALTKIKWEYLEVGDRFVDGSVVEEIREWTKKPCYTLKMVGFDPITLSHDHLLYGKIIINGRQILNLEKSAKSRWNVQENDPNWICVEDIYEFYSLGAKIVLENVNGEEMESIEPFKNLEPQMVRCISTSTGVYETNGVLSHNTARKLFYAMSDIEVISDCGGPYIDAMHCKAPEGNVCLKCAKLSKGGEIVKRGQLIGGLVSTNMSEALTQLSMKQMHVASSEVTNQLHGSAIIMNTLDGFSTSPIIEKMKECKTTEEMRATLYEGLKKEYQDAGIKQDDFNIMMVAKKLTSYKRSGNEIVPVKDGERCDVMSMTNIGNLNNIFKISELRSGYKHLTKPINQTLKKDASNQILK